LGGDVPTSRHYPLFLDISGQRCLVVGGGRVGERKVAALIEAGALVEVVSPKITDALSEWAESGTVDWHGRPFETEDVTGALLVFGATDDTDVNGAVASAAKQAGVLYNDAIERDRCDFIVPSTVRRGGLTLAASTGGGSPAYARLVRERLEETFGEEHGEVVALFEQLRPRVMALFPDDPSGRRAVWDQLVSWEMVEWVRDGNDRAIEERVTQCLSS
jgi:precorrin-2 dehydrogenase/sirohydrochlorin ferrochelatase